MKQKDFDRVLLSMENAVVNQAKTTEKLEVSLTKSMDKMEEHQAKLVEATLKDHTEHKGLLQDIKGSLQKLIIPLIAILAGAAGLNLGIPAIKAALTKT